VPPANVDEEERAVTTHEDLTGSDAGRLGRREFLIAGAGAGISAAGLLNHGAIARARAFGRATGGQFAYGVAAGFPGTTGVTLWTRVAELGRSARVGCEVALDPHFRRVVASPTAHALAGRDFTVHQPVRGLKPATEYYYRFFTRDAHSRVGRFRTLPPTDSAQPLKIGFYSCSSYEAGYFTALGGLAAEPDLDFVLCLGDYIYEHHDYDGPAARRDHTGVNHDGDVQTLAEYRQKYRLYQSDPHLQDMHAAYPFISIWDDHEVENNYAGTHPDSADTNPHLADGSTPRRVPFLQRRRNGYQAFFEAMPRMPFPGGANRIYGSIRLGSLAELYLTDSRQYRSPQPCDDVELVACPADLVPGGTMLGAAQKAWLKAAVPAGRAKWNLLTSETMMMALDSSPGNHVNQDQWDGYSAEREEILSSFLAAGVENLVVLSGDLHTFIAGNLTTTGESTGTPVGVELLGGSATSFGLPEETGIPAAKLEALLPSADPHIVFGDFVHHGYCVVTVTADQVTGQFKTADITRPRAGATTLATFQVQSGTPQLTRVS
jgi:alkaline phosphatase D